MGDQVYTLSNSFTIPVEPYGSDLGAGWLPGTWVTYSASAPEFSPSAIARVVRSDGIGVIAGFLIVGPQHKNGAELFSDMWTTDSRQREGGDNRYDWTGIDAGTSLEFDDENLVKRMGSRIATLCVAAEGIFKFYVFETENKAERNNPGTGSDLTYAPGDVVYVSENGLLTNEKETAGNTAAGYVVVKTGNDEEGDFLIISEARVP